MGIEIIPASEFDFVLPKGLVDSSGEIHQHGTMRLATARDEILVQRDRRTQENQAYGTLVMLAQVITRLGSLSEIAPERLEGLFTLDLAYLREFYNRINQQGNAYIPVGCPFCNGQFQVELALSGES